jgi:hypothetical protein
VDERLSQLDLILEQLGRALSDVKPDPAESRRNAEWGLQQGPRLAAGEITEEQYFAGVSRNPPHNARDYIRAWAEVRLFTETFYCVAWRLREILNAPTIRAFPNLRAVEAREVRDVRNLLIQHPEDGRPVPNVQQHMIVTDDGPSLKSSWFVIHGTAGRVSAAQDGVDRGRYINAKELRDELEARLAEALAPPAAQRAST